MIRVTADRVLRGVGTTTALHVSTRDPDTVVPPDLAERLLNHSTGREH